jgi:Flp pilus assembly pilin Flp
VRRFLSECGGVTALEYALMGALIAVVIIASAYTLGQQALTQLFNKVANSL